MFFNIGFGILFDHGILLFAKFFRHKLNVLNQNKYVEVFVD